MDIKKIRLGVTNIYLIKGNNGYVMIDTGEPRKEKKFFKALNRLNIKPQDIKLIIITHCHFDHVGSLAAIKDVINSPILIHPLEAKTVENADVIIPPGTDIIGKILGAVGKKLTWFLAFKGIKAEKLYQDEYDLSTYGINAKVINTPGHTNGSLSIIFNDGRAIVGDLAMNYPLHSKFPIFAEEPDKVYESWKTLIEKGVKKIYPAHGNSFDSIEIVRLLGKK
ncbi:hypothetical protein SYNTR_2223 [Candidatus Syntrophocurvum alkaliphilum]|uniref:Metallo-beta-lactamase domain-containing protein n=1 Tax=Candidatus Syntrophocurvum alkaliphilum TaxID=2293317 RepID=A0A6I6DM33_9FIRM|nr:MBL fold metallo-hydrolase [Candidatus Syntrophocurvum alkaliphilum]QGU00817.1 hypothetical protein SYNTR_2223 [Candidatus Syntrophocurvum alkaliphilum]